MAPVKRVGVVANGSQPAPWLLFDAARSHELMRNPLRA
jgi:hypothetical protein